MRITWVKKKTSVLSIFCYLVFNCSVFCMTLTEIPPLNEMLYTLNVCFFELET